MVKPELISMAAVLSLVATSVHGVCPYPEEVKIPDGSSATEDEMLDSQRRVKAYIAALEDYTKCLDREAAALGDDETPEQKAIHAQRHNAAVAAMEQAADQFNAQIRAYKSANE